MKNSMAILLVSVVLILLLAGCTGQGGNYQNPSPSPNTGSGNGRVVFTAADKAADMGAITSVKVVIDNIQVHSTSESWITVSSTPKVIDLMQLKASGNEELLADTQIPKGSYDQLRLQISSVVVTDAQGDHEAKLPSNDLKIMGNMEVKENSTATANFDFIASESLHKTGNGKFIMAPVIQVETRDNADVDVANNMDVKVNNGQIRTNAKVGMDEKGNVGVGIGIPADADISIDATGTIKVGGILQGAGSSQGRVVAIIKDKSANLNTITSVNITVDSVMAHNEAKGWVSLSSTPKTYDLMQLVGKEALLADAQLDNGTYEQMRLQISKVIVTDTEGTHEAKLPSGDLKINGVVVVNSNSTSTATFDFIPSESLHVTGNGQYIMAPVIDFESRENATVNVSQNNEINETDQGKLRTKIKVGMDENGTLGIGIGIPANAQISIDNNGSIKINKIQANASINVNIG
ncbi:DUF4382 domain-containing protein [Candidatus Micrarchaeota archaeon]|nr:DUF4382 domain-containing protein [Candidatus Micrarchaeota archaeon]